MIKQTLCSTVIKKNLSGYERLRLNVELNSNSGGQVLILQILFSLKMKMVLIAVLYIPAIWIQSMQRPNKQWQRLSSWAN